MSVIKCYFYKFISMREKVACNLYVEVICEILHLHNSFLKIYSCQSTHTHIYTYKSTQ